MFPRIAVHTGNSVVPTNKHTEWEGTIVLQHNETTSTMLSYGPKLTRKARKRHPLLSTFQSNCEAGHWQPFDTHPDDIATNLHSGLMFGQKVDGGKLVSRTGPPTVGVQPPVEHF